MEDGRIYYELQPSRSGWRWSQASTLKSYDSEGFEQPGLEKEGWERSRTQILPPENAHAQDSHASKLEGAAFAVDFEENDVENPQSWSKVKKIYHTGCVASMAFVGTFSSSAFTPGFTSLEADFAVSPELARLSFSIFVLGLAFGSPFSGPCSETFGRKAVYITSIPIFALFTLGTGFSQNIASVIITRFFAGAFASPSLSIGSSTLADMWSPAQRATPMALYVLQPYLGPALGPMLGAYVVDGVGGRGAWRWTSWLVLFFTAAFLIPVIFMSETYKQRILQRRATKLNAQEPSAAPRNHTKTVHHFLTTSLTRPIHMLFTEPVVTAFATWIACVVGLNYAFFAAYPDVYTTYYSFSLTQIGLTFLGLGAGCIIGCFGLVLMNKYYFPRRLARAKKQGKSALEPEERLVVGMAGGILVPISLFLFGWVAENRVSWIAPVVAEALFGFGNLWIFMSATLYVVQFYGPVISASAMGANTMLRYLVSFAFPLFITYMYDGMGVGWASSLLGFVSALLAVIPFVLYKVGPKLRQRSGYMKATG